MDTRYLRENYSPAMRKRAKRMQHANQRSRSGALASMRGALMDMVFQSGGVGLPSEMMLAAIPARLREPADIPLTRRQIAVARGKVDRVVGDLGVTRCGDRYRADAPARRLCADCMAEAAEIGDSDGCVAILDGFRSAAWPNPYRLMKL